MGKTCRWGVRFHAWRPLGALLGVALGHNFDKGLKSLPGAEQFEAGDQERVQTAFFTATFAVMGRVAKADGRVGPEEIRMAEAVMAEMSLAPECGKRRSSLFNQGKQRISISRRCSPSFEENVMGVAR